MKGALNTSALYWDSTYAIALAMASHYPDYSPENVGLEELAALVNERILMDIQIVWYEETTEE